MTECRSLLPQNHTPLERNLERVQCQQISTIPVPLRALWRVDECPNELLPWLAWALSVDVWDDSWSEFRKREVIRHSVEIHKHKGTLFAVQQAIESLGIEASVTEWWQDKAKIGRGRFRIDVNASDEGINTAEKQHMLRRYVDRVKRLSALYDVSANDHGEIKANVIATGIGVVSEEITIPEVLAQGDIHFALGMGITGHLEQSSVPVEPITFKSHSTIGFMTTNQSHASLDYPLVRIATHDIELPKQDNDSEEPIGQSITVHINANMNMAGIASLHDQTEDSLSANSQMKSTLTIQGMGEITESGNATLGTAIHTGIALGALPVLHERED